MDSQDIQIIEQKYTSMVYDDLKYLVDYARHLQQIKAEPNGEEFLTQLVGGGRIGLAILISILPAVSNWDQPYKVVRTV